MSITNGYATLSDLRGELGITDGSDVIDDSRIEQAVEAASRWIDEYTGRRFYRNSADETRYYTAEFSDLLLLPDDLGTITTLATDSAGDRTYEYTWATTDYDLLPANASLDSKPYTMIEVAHEGNYTFPVGIIKGVKIIGKFGWGTTAPLAVKRACILLASRIFRRKDATFGIMGSNAFGQVLLQIKADPDVELLLNPYRRLDVVGV